MKPSILLFPLLMTFACAPEETGTATFTTWGEEYIEEGIPSGDGGFVDGWSLKYEKFLVSFSHLQVADAGGRVGALAEQSFIVDNVKPGRKKLTSFDVIEAKAWDRVGYRIEPPANDATLVDATKADRERLLDGGYSIYIEATATKGEQQKKLALGFTTATQYTHCRAQEEGKETDGIVVTNGSEDVTELTTHGDHFFYDRLQGSAGANIETSLRFESVAAADTNEDGEVTAEELASQPFDVELYDPSGLPANSLMDFMTGLARTVGHFRGEGECQVSSVAD